MNATGINATGVYHLDHRGMHSLQTEHMDMAMGMTVPTAARPFIIPIAGLVIGAAMMVLPKQKSIQDVGKLVLYFGAQSFMNIYMGWVMRTSVTVAAGDPRFPDLTHDLTGCPAGFTLTALQQVISFFVFMIFMICAYFTPYRYMPRKLTSTFEYICVVIFGCVFAMNIALNNFSLGYISVAVNLIIRSCLPLTTFLSQQGLAIFGLYPFKPCKMLEISLMVLGVFFAGVFTVARILGSAKAGHSSSNMVLGVVMCIASLLCGSLNLALAGVLGEMKLNVYDTCAYMSVPATIFLLPFALFLQKPVPGQWSVVFNSQTMTDYQILMGVWNINKVTMAYVFLSGIFSFIYNIIQFNIVHTLSPSATAFGGNFNKAALIFLTLMLPFLRVHELPGPPYIWVIWAAVIGNILSFSVYSYLQIKAKEAAGAIKNDKHHEYDEEASEDGEDDDEDEEESSGDDKGMC